MKSVSSILSIIAIVILFASCSKEAKVLKKIDGIWAVEEVNFTADDGAILNLNPISASLTILSCKKAENKKTNTCEASYMEGTDIVVNFTYQVDADSENKILTFREAEDNIEGVDTYVSYFKGVNKLSFGDNDKQMIMENNSSTFEMNGEMYSIREVVLRRK